MANVPESSSFEAGIYQLETTDQVLGGEDGVSNTQAKQLANRTRWLKDQVDALNLLKGTGIPSFSTGNTYVAGQEVIYQNNIWRANTSIAAGAFNPANWTRQLGTSAEKAAQTSATDTTAGAVMQVGAFGLGSTNASQGCSSWTSVPLVSGVYGVAASASGRPSGLPDGFYILISGAFDSSVSIAYMISSGRMFSISRSNAGVWSAAVEMASLASPTLTGAPSAPTPPQFDKDTSLATTEFVRRQGLQFADVATIGRGSSMNASHVGKAIVLYDGDGIGGSVALPNPTLIPDGSCIYIINGTGSSTYTLTTPAGAINDNASVSITAPTSLLLFVYGGEWVAYGHQIETAAQFNASKMVANTEFVQRALGNFQSVVPIGTAVTLTAADAGKSYSMNAGSSIVLPLYSTVVAGASFLIINAETSVKTITRQGSDLIYGVTNGSFSNSATSVTLQSGDWCIIAANNAQWEVIAGSVLMTLATGPFGASLAQPGYQKLPSGLIIQWGAYTFSGSASAAVTFPIAFPNACMNFGPFNPNTSTFVSSTAISAAGATVAAASALSASGYWIAIGR